jgi:hypothetical protein
MILISMDALQLYAPVTALNAANLRFEQAVPSFRTPALSNPMPFHDQVRQSAFAQLLAPRPSGLTAANYEGFDVLGGHNAILF